MTPRRLLAFFLFSLGACDGVGPTVNPTQDASVFDLAETSIGDAVAPPDAPDGTLADVALSDAPASDVSSADVLDGSEAILGTLRATCGTIRAMLHSPSPSLVRGDLFFMAPERYVREALSPGGQRVFDTPNAGGSSTESEVVSYEVLHYCEAASLRATETGIRYAPPDDSGANSITDILVEIGGERVGVSVTRAYRPMPMVLTDADLRDLLTRKLEGVNRSSMRVLPADRWVKQILHVLAVDEATGAQVARVWATLDARVRADTIVLVTVTHGGGFIYCNPDPPLGSECPRVGS